MSEPALLVEDELLVALDLQDILESLPLVVDGPYDHVAHALEVIGDGCHCVAVLDVSLRDGDVFPLADELAELGVPMIFHSGHADTGHLLARYPAARFCPKPCSPSHLLATVRELLEAQV